jgi:hypothetical protein
MSNDERNLSVEFNPRMANNSREKHSNGPELKEGAESPLAGQKTYLSG